MCCFDHIATPVQNQCDLHQHHGRQGKVYTRSSVASVFRETIPCRGASSKVSQQCGFHGVKTWFDASKFPYLKGRPWYDHKYIFVPMFLTGASEWIVFLLNLETKSITCYDPLPSQNADKVYSYSSGSTGVLHFCIAAALCLCAAAVCLQR